MTLIRMPGANYTGTKYAFDNIGSSKIGGSALDSIRQARENLAKEAEAAKVRQESSPVPVRVAATMPVVRKRKSSPKVETLDTNEVHVVCEKFPAPYETNTETRKFSLPNLKLAKSFVKEAFSSGEFDKITITYFVREQSLTENGEPIPNAFHTLRKEKSFARNVAAEPKQSFKDESGILASHGICVRPDGYVADPESWDKMLLPLSTRNRYTRIIAAGKHGEFKPRAVCETKDYNRNPRWQKNAVTTKVTFSHGLACVSEPLTDSMECLRCNL